MPFTVSHVVAVLPLRSRRALRDRLPTAPLVAGSMAPDLPTVLGAHWLRASTHDLLGALTLDVVLAVVMVAAWRWGVRPLVAVTVPPVAARWEPTASRGWAGAPWWYVAAAIGSLTHIVWDAFTHSGESDLVGLSVLPADGRLFFALQLVSSVVGLALLAGWTWAWWRRTAVRARGARVPRLRLAVCASVLGVCVLSSALVRGAVMAAAVERDHLDPSGVVGEAVFGALAGAVLGAVALALAYRLELRVRPASRPTGPPTVRTGADGLELDAR